MTTPGDHPAGATRRQRPERWRYHVGDRLGSFVIRERLPRTGRDVDVMVECDCGNVVKRRLGNLASGATVNCADRSRHPDPRRKAHVTYSGAHSRVKRAMGSASGYRCVGCGRQAQVWAYDHADPDARTDLHGREAGRPYSLDPSHYESRCDRCHSRWDDQALRLAGRVPPGEGRVSLLHYVRRVRRLRRLGLWDEGT